MVDVPCFVGIDVAKAQLDIALHPTGARWAVPNDSHGLATLVERLQEQRHNLAYDADGVVVKEEVQALITAIGGRVMSSVRRQTDEVVAGAETGSQCQRQRS